MKSVWTALGLLVAGLFLMGMAGWWWFAGIGLIVVSVKSWYDWYTILEFEREHQGFRDSGNWFLAAVVLLVFGLVNPLIWVLALVCFVFGAVLKIYPPVPKDAG